MMLGARMNWLSWDELLDPTSMIVTKAEVEQMALGAVAKFLKLDLEEFLPKSDNTNTLYVFLHDQATLAASVLNALKPNAH